MKKNLSNTDRIIRILVAAVVAILFFTGMITGMTATILLIAGGILLLTGFVSFCPLYFALGLSSRKKE